MPREHFLNHGQNLGGETSATKGEHPLPPTPRRPRQQAHFSRPPPSPGKLKLPCQRRRAPSTPASPALFPDCRGNGERVPTPFTSSGAMESGAAGASAPRGWRRRLPAGAEGSGAERSGAEGPALSSRLHPAALRLEPVAQPAPHKCINSSHIMINSSVPVTRGGGTRRGAGAGERQRARERPFARSSHTPHPSPTGAGLRQRGGRGRGRGAAAARALPGLREREGDSSGQVTGRSLTPPTPPRAAGTPGSPAGASRPHAPPARGTVGASTGATRAAPARWRRDRAPSGQRPGKGEETAGRCEGSTPRRGFQSPLS